MSVNPLSIKFNDLIDGKSELISLIVDDIDDTVLIKLDKLSKELKDEIKVFDFTTSKITSLFQGERYIQMTADEMINCPIVPFTFKMKINEKYFNNDLNNVRKMILSDIIDVEIVLKKLESRNIFIGKKLNFYSETALISQDSQKRDLRKYNYIDSFNIDLSDVDVSKLLNTFSGTYYVFTRNVRVPDNLLDRYILILNYIEKRNKTLYIKENSLQFQHDMFVKSNFNFTFLKSPLYYFSDEKFEKREVSNLCMKIKHVILNVLGNDVYNAIDWNSCSFAGGMLVNIIKHIMHDCQLKTDCDIDIVVSADKPHDFRKIVNKFIDKTGANSSKINYNNVCNVEYKNTIFNFIWKHAPICYVVSEFYFSACICYFDGSSLHMSPSCLVSNIFMTIYSYADGRKIAFEDIEKYYQKGYNFIFNNREGIEFGLNKLVAVFEN